MSAEAARQWCTCPDAPVHARGASTKLDHREGCEFPTGICAVRAHRITVHEKCGRVVPVLFCGCGSTAFTFDPERGWWVHYVCAWPTRAWYEGAGRPPALPDLVGVRPLTYHEFVPVPRVPKRARNVVEPLTPEQRQVNDVMVGQSVWD